MDKTEQMQQEVLQALCKGNIPVTNIIIGDQVQSKVINNYYGQPTSHEDESVPKSPKGAPVKYLFTTNGKDKDIDTSMSEATKFMHYLKDHRWDKNLITSKACDKVNIALRCFVEVWYKRKMIGNTISPAAIVRFLQEDCHLNFEVEEGAFKCCLTSMLKQNCDEEILYDVKNYFN